MKLWTLLVILLLGTTAATAAPAPRRFALLIGSNAGDRTEVQLRYAEDDARRVGDILARVGEFPPDQVVALLHPTVRELSRTLDELNRRLDGDKGETLLFVFYSGHADAETIHLGGGRFPIADLRDFISRSSATARVLVVDACRSGAVTRVKGGRPGPSFEVNLEPPVAANGYAILTSSAAGEEAQESDELRGSFFTHYLSSALLGAADRDGDGSVTLDEAFTYAAERTLVATAATVTGPQHPTYRFDLSGRDTLTLTRPGQTHDALGLLEFPRGGWFLVRRSGGPVLAEVHAAQAGRRLALEAGSYRVTLRLPDYYLEGDVQVRAGATVVVPEKGLRRVEYMPVAKKGGSAAEIELVRSKPRLRWRASYYGGLGVFTAAYLVASVSSAQYYFQSPPAFTLVDAGFLYLPVVGPLVTGGRWLQHAELKERVVGGLLIADGVTQAVGVAMLIAGDVMRRREQPAEKKLTMAPLLLAGGGGLTLAGRF